MKSLLPLFILLNACAVKVTLPSNHFITSETNGKSGGAHFNVRSQSGTEIDVINDPLSSSPNITPDAHQQSEVGVAASIGLFRNLDIYYHEGQDSMAVAGVKIQLLGTPRAESSAGSFSLSIAGGVGFGDGDEEQSSDDTEAAINVDFSGYEAAVILGYRLGDKLLIYTGPYIAKTTADITSIRTVSSVSATTSVSGEGEVTGANLGLFLGGKTGGYVIVEGSLSKTNWKRTLPTELEIEDTEEAFLGGALGYSF